MAVFFVGFFKTKQPQNPKPQKIRHKPFCPLLNAQRVSSSQTANPLGCSLKRKWTAYEPLIIWRRSSCFALFGVLWPVWIRARVTLLFGF